MALIDPRSTERDNQNALRKYPFSDAASCANGACVLPPGAIIDAQLYAPGREPGRAWLSRVDSGGRLHFADAAGEFAKTAAPATPDAAVPVTFTGDGGPCPGGVVVFGGEAAVSALLSLGGQRFTAGQAELAPAAVAWPGLPGVCGFRLDDGHVVYGDVRIRGENGCVVATYRDEAGVPRLRISAVGRTSAGADATTGFVTRIVADSDNINFVVSPREGFNGVIDLTLTGVSTLLDDALNADQDNLCAQVRARTGAGPSARVSGAQTCEDAACAAPDARPHTLTLMAGDGEVGTVTVMRGEELGTLRSDQIPEPPPGKRFAGYFEAAKGAGRLYYRYDGSGVGVFDRNEDVTLHAHFIAGSSQAEATFADSCGTLHLTAPNTDDGYSNPLRISGRQSPVPVVREHADDELEAGGAEALAEIVLHPTVPSGEVHIELRGSDKATLL